MKEKRHKTPAPQYGVITVTGGQQYYRTRVRDSYGHRIPVYGKTPEEVHEKKQALEQEMANNTYRRPSPTVSDYCEKWTLMQSAVVRTTTLVDYRSKIQRHIVATIGDMHMADVTPDDIQVVMLSAADKSKSVYKGLVVLLKSIFRSAKASHLIDEDPTVYLTAKGGGAPQKEKTPLTDDQVEILLDAVRGFPTYTFVMLGLYAGLRREEILGLQWDSVFLDADAPYLTVQRAWHTEHNRPVVSMELKTKAAHRNIPLPDRLVACLKEAKKESKSQYVIANSDGGPLSYTQYKRLWHRVVTRTAGERTYSRYENGAVVKRTICPQLGEKARHNGVVTYTIDFHVSPHLLRHTYITNLIHAGVDPKTVQYLAGHESSKITMDIYAKVKYHQPKDLATSLSGAFAMWDEESDGRKICVGDGARA